MKLEYNLIIMAVVCHEARRYCATTTPAKYILRVVLRAVIFCSGWTAVIFIPREQKYFRFRLANIEANLNYLSTESIHTYIHSGDATGDSYNEELANIRQRYYKYNDQRTPQMKRKSTKNNLNHAHSELNHHRFSAPLTLHSATPFTLAT